MMGMTVSYEYLRQMICICKLWWSMTNWKQEIHCDYWKWIIVIRKAKKCLCGY